MATPTRARNFFLNEVHELATIDKSGGGRTPDYVGISWAQKSTRISQSIDKVLRDVKSSKDPLRDERYFVLARPVAELEKKSTDIKKAPNGTFKGVRPDRNIKPNDPGGV